MNEAREENMALKMQIRASRSELTPTAPISDDNYKHVWKEKEEWNFLFKFFFSIGIIPFVVYWHYVIATEGLELKLWELNLQKWK